MFYHPFRHLGLKALAVVAAFLLWFMVAGEQTVERSLSVPLELQNLPERFELVESPPPTVGARVRGPAGLLSRLQPGDVVAIIDLSTARAGRRLFPLTRDHVRAPFGIEVAQVTPGTVALLFEASGTRRVSIVPDVEGEPAAGFVVDHVTTEPATVEVAGPESALRRLDRAVTDPVLIDGSSRTVREVVNIGVRDPALRLRSPGGATVTVAIVPAPVERVLSQVPVRMRNLGRGLSSQALPATLSATVKGRRDVVDAQVAASLPVFVDLAGLGPGQYNLQVRLDPTQDLQLVRTEPAAVRVRIK